MEEMEQPIKVYVKINENKEVIAVGSSIFITDTTGWIEIDNSTSGKPRDVYAHAQSQYFEKALQNEDGTYNYGYSVEGDVVYERIL